MSSLVDARVRAIEAEWAARGGITTRADYISLQLGQLMEAVQHDDRNESERFANEMADMVSIAWQAIRSAGFDDVEAFVVARIDNKILPKMSNGEIEAKYRLQRNGTP